MNTSSLAQLKKELQSAEAHQLVELLIRIGKYKKDNKELLHYLLFESDNEEAFIERLKIETEEQFAEINLTTVYFGKKTIRKILRNIHKHIKYSGKPETAIELLMFFLAQFRKLPASFYQSTVLTNLYASQRKRIDKELAKLHEDIQYDFMKRLNELENT